jgi:hypothetical protein
LDSIRGERDSFYVLFIIMDFVWICLLLSVMNIPA